MIIGIDPGKSGAIALMDGFKVVDVWDISNQYEIIDALIDCKNCGATLAVVEKVHSMPRQGVSSTFNFGFSFGLLQGALMGLKIPYLLITPQQWQKKKGICVRRSKPTKSQDSGIPKVVRSYTDKSKSVELARQQYLGSEKYLKLKKHHGRADAMHIATCGGV